MLGSITIRGFKSVVEAELELGRLNVFIGANGSGKSVVLEAIGVLGAAADGRVDDTALLRRGVRPGVPALYKNAFAAGENPPVITLCARSSDSPPVVYEVSLDNLLGKGGSPWRFTHELLAVGEGRRARKYVSRGPGGAKLWGLPGRTQSFKPQDATRSVADTPNPLGEPPSSVREFLGRLRSYTIYDPQTPVLRGLVAEQAPLDPLGVSGGRLAEALNEVLKQPRGGLDFLVDLIGWAENFGTSSPRPDFVPPSVAQQSAIVCFLDRFMREDRNLLSAHDASEGALYILFTLVLFHHPRAPRIFAIENIDHALHPHLARRLIELMATWNEEFNKQVLLTTHTPLVLDALDLHNESVRLFTVERNKHGHTVVHRLPVSAALQRAQESGLTLSQMWTRGLIGAVPNVL